MPEPIAEAGLGSRYGAFDIDSIPPVTTTSCCPARIIRSASAIARSDEAHTLLIVSAGTSFGIACADGRLARGRLPGTGLQHLAHDDVPDLGRVDPDALEPGPDRDRAELRSPAGRASPPPRRPNGVRTAETITERVMRRSYRRRAGAQRTQASVGARATGRTPRAIETVASTSDSCAISDGGVRACGSAWRAARPRDPARREPSASLHVSLPASIPTGTPAAQRPRRASPSATDRVDDRAAEHRRPAAEGEVAPRLVVRTGHPRRTCTRRRPRRRGASRERRDGRSAGVRPTPPGRWRPAPRPRAAGRRRAGGRPRGRRTRPTRSSRAAEANRPFGELDRLPDEHRRVARADERLAPGSRRRRRRRAGRPPTPGRSVHRRARATAGTSPAPVRIRNRRPTATARPPRPSGPTRRRPSSSAPSRSARSGRRGRRAPASGPPPRCRATTRGGASRGRRLRTTAPSAAASRRTIADTALLAAGRAGSAQELVEEGGDRHRPKHYATRADGDPRGCDAQAAATSAR